MESESVMNRTCSTATLQIAFAGDPQYNDACDCNDHPTGLSNHHVAEDLWIKIEAVQGCLGWRQILFLTQSKECTSRLLANISSQVSRSQSLMGTCKCTHLKGIGCLGIPCRLRRHLMSG